MKPLLRVALLTLMLSAIGAARGEACGVWLGAGVPAFPPCAAPPAYYAYPPVYYAPYPYGPWVAPPFAYSPYSRGPEYWYYRSLRRDDWYDRPRIHGYTLR